MIKGYSQFEHTADIGISATGSDLRELFTNFALGLFDVICDMGKVLPLEEIKVNISSSDLESLLVKWLNELIYIFDSKRMLLSQFDIKTVDHDSLTAVVSGEKINPKRHELRLSVKAATYHQLKVEKTGPLWQAEVIFDV